jgi:hypothetical protein
VKYNKQEWRDDKLTASHDRVPVGRKAMWGLYRAGDGVLLATGVSKECFTTLRHALTKGFVTETTVAPLRQGVKVD